MVLTTLLSGGGIDIFRLFLRNIVKGIKELLETPAHPTDSVLFSDNPRWIMGSASPSGLKSFPEHVE